MSFRKFDIKYSFFSILIWEIFKNDGLLYD